MGVEVDVGAPMAQGSVLEQNATRPLEATSQWGNRLDIDTHYTTTSQYFMPSFKKLPSGFTYRRRKTLGKRTPSPWGTLIYIYMYVYGCIYRKGCGADTRIGICLRAFNVFYPGTLSACWGGELKNCMLEVNGWDEKYT